MTAYSELRDRLMGETLTIAEGTNNIVDKRIPSLIIALESVFSILKIFLFLFFIIVYRCKKLANLQMSMMFIIHKLNYFIY